LAVFTKGKADESLAHRDPFFRAKCCDGNRYHITYLSHEPTDVVISWFTSDLLRQVEVVGNAYIGCIHQNKVAAMWHRVRQSEMVKHIGEILPAGLVLVALLFEKAVRTRSLKGHSGAFCC